MECPTCTSEKIKVDYRVAFPQEGSHWYQAECENCGAKLQVEVDPDDVNKMVKLKGG